MILSWQEFCGAGERNEAHYVIPCNLENYKAITSYVVDAQYQVYLIKYNTLLFGSACNEEDLVCIFINPYVELKSVIKLPQPISRKTVYEALIDSKVNFVDEVLHGYAADIPNGFDGKAFKQWFNIEVGDYYRPWSGEELDGKYLATHIILHPWMKRRLIHDELELIRDNEALEYLDTAITNIGEVGSVLLEPFCKFDDISGRVPPKEYRVNVENSFHAKDVRL